MSENMSTTPPRYLEVAFTKGALVKLANMAFSNAHLGAYDQLLCAALVGGIKNQGSGSLNSFVNGNSDPWLG